jgi:hypothetical protein
MLKHLHLLLLAFVFASACGGDDLADKDITGEISLPSAEDTLEVATEQYELFACRGAGTNCCDARGRNCVRSDSCSTFCGPINGGPFGEATCSNGSCTTGPRGNIIAIDASCGCVYPE